MIIDKNIEVKLSFDVSHYYTLMNEHDIKTLFIKRISDLTNADTTWIDMWEIFYNKKHVGYMKFYKDLENRSFDVRCLYIVEKFRSKDIAKRVSMQLYKYYFDTYDFNKVESGCASYNKESFSFQNKFMITEGIKRQNIFYKGAFYDEYHFGLLKKEFYLLYNKYKGILKNGKR